ncbi:MAG: glycoside hydrolase family 65 protein [Candidatus Fimimonas sp.]
MAKTALKHFDVDSWKVTEREFSKEFSQVAESVFSLGNEFMGSRGFLEEGVSAPTLRGSYFNGVYEYATDKNATGYKGIATRMHFMVNGAHYFDLEIVLNGEVLDMAKSKYGCYCRTLNLQTGKLFRNLTWQVGDVSLSTEFCRFLDMQFANRAYQQVKFTANQNCRLQLRAKMHFDGKHFGAPSRWQPTQKSQNCLECQTESTAQRLACAMATDVDGKRCDSVVFGERSVEHVFEIALERGKTAVFTRLVSVWHNKDVSAAEQATAQLQIQQQEGYRNAFLRNDDYWREFWKNSDIEIEGDEENQQGIRFCIFQLQQTYHGANPSHNIGAKGLTGEAYSGHAFWDTETYCLPYYLFNNPKAAKYLLEYRYSTLPQAKLRAKDLDCNGACYPIATLNGEEACTLWQHASLQMQPSTGVAYGIFHYCNVCKDDEFLYTHGAEMLVEICRYLVSRGQWNSDGSYFGYYAVMGPDEFQMMVNHNTYTNFMAKKTLLYTLQVLQQMPQNRIQNLVEKTHVSEEEQLYWKKCADKMLILYNPDTMLYEQHDGFFKLPHVNVDDIPDSEFPLYSHWSYDRIYRNDMIKQPDVLMFQLLYNGDFSTECIKANYEYYEPRCIHESSLSPSVHSILANQVGKQREAVDFFAFATRMDLDDYNRNTKEGLHTTSIAAAWLNIVYGFGGLRSDKEISIAPTLPDSWKSYSFSLTVGNSHLKIKVSRNGVTVTNDGAPVVLTVYGKKIEIVNTVEI